LSETNDIPILYGPRDGKSLRKTYPDIEDNPVFKDMPNDDLLFSWYIGIPGSPIDDELIDKVRFQAAAKKCFPANKKKQQEFGGGDLPEKVRLAIEEFKRKSPEARLLAKRMTQKTFEKFQELLNVDVEKDFVDVRQFKNEQGEVETVREVNWSGRKAYVDSATKIVESLPDLVKKIEEGFGITDKKKSEQVAGRKPIDLFHKNNEEKSK
jgi:hypothetical protein